MGGTIFTICAGFQREWSSRSAEAGECRERQFLERRDGERFSWAKVCFDAMERPSSGCTRLLICSFAHLLLFAFAHFRHVFGFL